MTSTARIYTRAKQAFLDWRVRVGASGTPDHDEIARYLQHCVEHRGITSAPVHLSAIADLLRGDGQVLDTKHPAIRTVMEAVRRRRGRSNTEKDSAMPWLAATATREMWAGLDKTVSNGEMMTYFERHLRGAYEAGLRAAQQVCLRADPDTPPVKLAQQVIDLIHEA